MRLGDRTSILQWHGKVHPISHRNHFKENCSFGILDRLFHASVLCRYMEVAFTFFVPTITQRLQASVDNVCIVSSE